jgi:hypothetical protein
MQTFPQSVYRFLVHLGRRDLVDEHLIYAHLVHVYLVQVHLKKKGGMVDFNF